MCSTRHQDARPLTSAEIELARSVFGDAVDFAAVRVVRRCWWPLQPRRVVMAPRGAIHIHPRAPFPSDCLASHGLGLQALLIHELVHVWQHQRGLNLLFRRLPFARYEYTLHPGRRFEQYGIEQQAMIVQHMFVLRAGARLAQAPPLPVLEALVPFTGMT